MNDGNTPTPFSLDDAAVFVRVAEAGGFAPASRLTGQPKSTLSKRVAMLEAQLGVRLLNRNSRRISLTEVGEEFYAHVAAMLIEAEAAGAVVQNRLAGPKGPVRITASVITARYHLSQVLPEIAETHPEVQLMLHATDRMVDIVREAFDIALRDHHQPLPPSELVQRRIGFEPDFLVASPAYLDRQGSPRHPDELTKHDGLINGPVTGPHVWRLEGPGGAIVTVAPRLKAIADDPDTLAALALSGLGISALPRCQCEGYLERGELVRILPEWISGGATTTLLVPHRRGQLPAVKAVAEALATALRKRLDSDGAARRR